ncbi:polyadenylate-binding protein 1-A-like isoform X2 [Argonauta hians]
MASNVYSCHVRPLPLSISKIDLAGVFCEYRDFIECTISNKPTLHDFTFGFVMFQSWVSAEHAVKNVTGKLLNGHKLIVSHAKHSDYFSCNLLLNNFKKTLRQEFGLDNKAISDILEEAKTTRYVPPQHMYPECVSSADLTDILTDAMNSRFWNKFFLNQKRISEELKKSLH